MGGGARDRTATNSRSMASRFPQKPEEAIVANRTITPIEIDSWQGFSFNSSGSARDVILPPEASSAGVNVRINNKSVAAAILTIKNDGGDTIATPAEAQAADVVCDGVAWTGLVGDSS